MFGSQKDPDISRGKSLCYLYRQNTILKQMKVTTDKKSTRVTSPWPFYSQIHFRCRKLEYEFAFVFPVEKVKHKD